MTRTIQSRSGVYFGETGEGNINTREKETNRLMFLSVIDSLNNLYEKLTRLNNVMERKLTEYGSLKRKGDRN